MSVANPVGQCRDFDWHCGEPSNAVNRRQKKIREFGYIAGYLRLPVFGIANALRLIVSRLQKTMVAQEWQCKCFLRGGSMAGGLLFIIATGSQPVLLPRATRAG
jgi:hypothetical protein